MSRFAIDSNLNQLPFSRTTARSWSSSIRRSARSLRVRRQFSTGMTLSWAAAGFVLNYFNYFTEIEEYFQTKREVFTRLSTLDWVLVETWKEQGVPLDCVFKGIDRAFSRPDAKRKIGSLAYCIKPVAEICDEQKDLRTEKPFTPE